MRDRPQRKIQRKQLSDYYYPPNRRRGRENKTQPRNQSLTRDSNKEDLQPPVSPAREASPSPPNPQEASDQIAPSPSTATATTFSSLKPAQKLEQLYLDPDFPTAYSGALKKFLQTKESLSRHRQRQKKFKRRKTLVYGPYQLLQADTVFYKDFARQNGGHKYILVVIDCFSRKNWLRPQKTTTAEETARNLDDILGSMDFKPVSFASDQGNEFHPKNPAIQKILIEKYGLVMYTLKAPIKAGIAERFIRTLKSRLERYFSEHNTVRWIDVLPKISKALNNSYHRSIGMTPNEVNHENRREVFEKLYGANAPPIKCKFRVGDKVRIPITKQLFDKGYKPNWTKEIFEVVEKRSDSEVCFYTVKSNTGEILEKKFYEQELNLVLRNEIS